MAYGDQICACCGSADAIEEHHLYLRSDGCPDDLTVFLCAPCHGRTHQMKRRIDISEATRAGLQRARERGVALGNPNLLGGYRGGPTPTHEHRARAVAAKKAIAAAHAAAVLPHIKAFKAGHPNATLQEIADHLGEIGITPPRGGVWYPRSISRVMERMVSE